MVDTKKFSEFLDGGNLEEGSTPVGLSGGQNATFTTLPQFLPPGTTAQRPDPATAGMIRYNTDLNLYEFYNGTIWTQFEDSADIALLIARLAAHTAGDGASMIGLEDQGAVSDKTVQDLAEADFIVKSITSALTNAIALSGLSTGLLVNENGTGNLVARSITGTVDQIDVTNGSGLSGDPSINISSNPTLPGSSHVIIPFGTTAQRPGVASNGYLRYNTDLDNLEFYDVNAAAWVPLGDEQVGGSNGQIQYNNNGAFAGDSGFTTDGAGNLDINGSIDLNSSTVVNAVLNEDDMVSNSATSLATQQSIKTYVDNQTADIHFLQPVRVASTSNFSATYDNGSSGVGATLTANSNGAASIDGVSLSLNDRALFKNQTNAFENGPYFVSQVGDASNPAIYTRTTDFDEPSEIVAGDLVTVLEGNTLEHTAWLQTADVTTVGTDAITFVQFAADFDNIVTLDGSQTITGIKTFTAANLYGTPASITLTNATGLPVSTGISGLGSGIADWLATPSSANLATAVTDETGTGPLVFANTPSLVTPDIGAATGTSINLGATTTVSSVLDEDDMVSDSDTALATQQSIKAYVDNKIADDSPWVLLATATPSGVANVDFTDLSTDFFAYKIFLENVHPATDGANFQLLVSTDNGATFITASASYRVARDSISTSNTTGSGNNSATNISMVINVGNVAGTEGIVGEMQIINPADAGSRTGIVSLMHYINAAGETHVNVCGGSRLNAEANDAIRLQFSSGNIASGTIKLYGIRAT